MTKTALVIHDPRDRSKDEMLTISVARNLYHIGHLDLDETNSKPDAPVYTPAKASNTHPQWLAWREWYAANYTSYIPMRDGQPINVDTLLSWKTWCKATEVNRPRWRKFTDEHPVPDDSGTVEIVWRDKPVDGVEYDVGMGWYLPEDAAEWLGEWLLVSELQ